MKKTKFLAALLAMACLAGVAVSCDDDDDDDVTDPNGTTEETGTTLTGGEISGRYTENLTLKEGNYSLTGSLQMVAPAVLTIEAGTTITAANNGEIIYILIEQGAQIQAVGTASKPIVMTSANTTAGGWGGIHICGYAHTNSGSDTYSEIGDAAYGGSDDTDNSGTIKYVIIKYSGYALDEEHEANGISLYGVGSGTTISYVHVDMGGDDGIEFFGGSVNIDHTVVTNCSDDSYDWTEGWNGTAEYIVAYQASSDVLGYDCDCLMECDNNGSDYDATPLACPTIKYATLIGNDSSDNKRGIRLRAGTGFIITNTLVTGKAKAITLATTQTVGYADAGSSYFGNVVISNEIVNEEGSGYDNDSFVAAGNTANYDVASALSSTYIGQVSGAGAVSSSSDWTSGWVSF